ncbi:unnamed protein product [[Actinomadura] parvosata subsp. kistnae]|uniref:Uncharacterized protein n=1 Tax=[Actinomadura] parvosata subsp. kistnae TaxID=1909395 RepID=A0A1V0A4K0_9ACTN|nr:hypothetical protein [Nonomuraea sp. ATCC 55076]AQZ65118.1 hypothetical protein BKM31_30035 [Nonomuraea sp. ATCC 55076]SPL96400.1 unnamed protein product [Actinomadura parvosata subsp. kistnae]
MTRYAIDRARHTLIAQWGTGIGDTATVVARLTHDQLPHDTRKLAAELTHLSQLCWRSYTHPASAADQHGPHSLGRHRQQERDAFDKILPLLIATAPFANQPITTKVEQAALAIARTLRKLDSSQLTTHITTDVAAELAAIEQAERGDLSDRAQQAVALSREDASPLQISQADHLLHDNPFGSQTLFTEVDPTAAAIAAAHWYHAAVTVTAQHTALHPMQVVGSSEQPDKPLAVESLSDIATALDTGRRARHVVMPLIRNALHVADGYLRGILGVQQRITAAQEFLQTARPGVNLSPDAIHLPLTSLNPARPAPDLLDNLLYGIDTCWHLYQHHSNRRSPNAGAVEAAQQDQLRQAFLSMVRKEAATRSERLL